MSRINGTTERQTLFLRAFRNNPDGPPPHVWPSPALFRRWMRRPNFARAIESLLDAIRLETDFHLATAARNSARQIAQASLPAPAPAPASPASDPNAPATTPHAPPAPKPLDPHQLLRLHHLRQRFPAHNNPKTKPRDQAEPELSEREQVYQYGGEDAVKAYDELCRLREQEDHEDQHEDEHHHRPGATHPPTP